MSGVNLSIHNIGRLYDELVNLVIRPLRAQYDPNVSLGPRLFTLANRIFERKDFVVTNSRNLNIQCSLYQPIDSQRPATKLPCVIYCHGNCGSRCDALDAVQILLPYNIQVLAFDFCGSGLSDGDYVSLGYYEKQDVAAIVDHLWSSGRVSRIGLWGRSMGAATSLQYASIDQTVAGIVVDSPFTSLEDVMYGLVLSHQSWVPRRLIKVGINIMRKTIMSRAAFDIRKNAPIDYVRNCFVPALFAHAEGDDFIKIHHSEKLYELYAGDKNLIRMDGDHNSERPEFFYDSVAIFFYNVLIANSELDEHAHPTGSIATKMGVGKPSDKGRQIAEQERDADEATQGEVISSQQILLRNKDESGASASSSNHRSPPSSPIGVGKLPQRHHNNFPGLPSSPRQQIVMPHSLRDAPSFLESDHDSSSLEEDEQLIQVLIESVRDELRICNDERERTNLQQRLDELSAQAQLLASKQKDQD